ncbi:MAG TPA: DNA polymerase III subunit delta [Candidatus Cloacimonadota bacterium]|nr:DNA polymerase III subunit delta [Candidatus Cloacimonadota bacterium]
MAVKTDSSSTKITFDELPRYTDKIKIHRNFCILGAEAFQKNEALKIILKTFNIEEFDSFDSFQVYGDDYTSKANPVSNIIEQLNMMPFVQPQKTLVLKNYDDMNADNQEQVVKYLAHYNPDSLFIFTAEKLDSRTARAKKIYETCMTIECKEIRSISVLSRWLNDEVRRRGLEFDEKAKIEFLNTIEMDFYIASNELYKLELYIGKHKRITMEDVKNCTASSKTFTVFEMIDEIGYKRVQKAIMMADNLLENDESHIMILTMITNLFMTLWKLSAIKSKNISDTELKARYMNDILPFFRDKYINFLKNYPLVKIKKAIELLLETDRQAKLTMASDYVLIETLIYKLCHL